MLSHGQLASKRSSFRATLGLAFLGLAQLACPSSAGAETAVIEGKDRWLFPSWESLTNVDHGAINRSIALIREARDRLAARDIELLALVVPLKAQFYAARLPQGQSISGDIRARYDFILTELGKAGIATLDVRPILRNVEAGGRTAYYRADYHWSAWSAEATAEQLAEFIGSKWKLRGRAGSGVELGEWINERHFGDLAANFLSAEKRALIGRDTYTIRQPAKNRSGLLDQEPAPVHVIGDSFVQPYFGFSQKLSNAIDRPVSLTWNRGDVGPWASFLQYVESKQFATVRPQVIVWQFNEGRMHLQPDAIGDWHASSIISPEVWRNRIAAPIGR